jgi:hypothetical protein
MFSAAFRTPFHQPGLSLPYLHAYSSLHCLCGVQLLYCSLRVLAPFVNHQISPDWQRENEILLCTMDKMQKNRLEMSNFLKSEAA